MSKDYRGTASHHKGRVRHRRRRKGHGLPWWRALLTDLAAAGRVKTIAIEHEDPFVAPEIGIQQAARLLAEALDSAARTKVDA